MRKKKLRLDWSEATRHLCRVDAEMAKIVGAYEGETLQPRGDLFYTLIRSIVGQQISTKAAQAIWNRLTALLGEVTPTHILNTGADQLAGVGLSKRKVEYLQGIAREGPELLQIPWKKLNDEAAIARLCELRGVGRWTAEMLLIFSLQRPDILPLADIGLVRAIEKIYGAGKELSGDELTHIAEPWRPWRSVATWYLWRSLDPIPVEY